MVFSVRKQKKLLNSLKNRFSVIKMITAVLITIGSVAFSIDYIIVFFQKYISPTDRADSRDEVNPDHFYNAPAHANREYLAKAMKIETGSLGNGLSLCKNKKYTVWKNEIDLNFRSAREDNVSITGYIVLPEDCKVLKLRASIPYGSERLRFIINNVQRKFISDRHRYIELKVSEVNYLKLQIGRSIAANPWRWGVLEWSVNYGNWEMVPVSYLFHTKDF